MAQYTHTHTHTHGYNVKEKVGIKVLCKIVVFCLIGFLCLNLINTILKRKEAYQKTADFFEQKENFDVLFFGSSHMINAVFPMELWNDYGIISYNMGNHHEYLPVSYYNMLLALEETNPKLVVIDVYQVNNKEKLNMDRKNYLYSSLGVYPTSITKYRAIEDLFDKKDTLNNTINYLFEFSTYHARWSELEEKDFINNNTYEKGAESRINVAVPNKMSEFGKVKTYEGKETVNMEYLRKMIEYCQNNQIEILVVNLPYPASNSYISTSKYVQKICEEYNVNYINFFEKNVVDFATDCYDGYSHVNVSGARKVTDYLGQYIEKNYNISNQRKNKAYDFWNEDYNEYISLKINNLKKNENNLNNYLMLLYGEEDIRYEIEVSSKKEIEKGSVLEKLLANINNNYTIDDTAFEQKRDKTIKITTWDNRNGKEIATVWF